MVDSEEFRVLAESMSEAEVSRVGTLVISACMPNFNSPKAGAAALEAVYRVLREREPKTAVG